MREGEQSDRIYVVVDSSKTVRCGWCGIMESGGWQHTRRGIFCSTECAFAAEAPMKVLYFLVLAALSVFLLVRAGLGGLVLLVPLLMFGPPSLIYAIMGITQRMSLPSNSRADKVSFDTALLKTVSSSVNCPRCDANLDLRRIGMDRVYACGYCGATGTIAIIDKSEQRGSGSGGRSERPISGS